MFRIPIFVVLNVFVCSIISKSVAVSLYISVVMSWLRQVGGDNRNVKQNSNAFVCPIISKSVAVSLYKLAETSWRWPQKCKAKQQRFWVCLSELDLRNLLTNIVKFRVIDEIPALDKKHLFNLNATLNLFSIRSGWNRIGTMAFTAYILGECHGEIENCETVGDSG